MQHHILVVDDSPLIRRAATRCLRVAGYLVTEAASGNEGLLKLESIYEKNHGVSLILTDMNMPEMDGIAFIRAVRKGHFRFVPILVLSSEDAPSLIESSLSEGASGWLPKPFDPDLLIRAIKKLVWFPC